MPLQELLPHRANLLKASLNPKIHFIFIRIQSSFLFPECLLRP